jgi:hypothetical protein
MSGWRSVLSLFTTRQESGQKAKPSYNRQRSCQFQEFPSRYVFQVGRAMVCNELELSKSFQLQLLANADDAGSFALPLLGTQSSKSGLSLSAM